MLRRTKPHTPGAQAVVSDMILRGRHINTIVTEIGLVPVEPRLRDLQEDEGRLGVAQPGDRDSLYRNHRAHSDGAASQEVDMLGLAGLINALTRERMRRARLAQAA